MPTVAPLTPADAERYAELRRQMLRDAPWAFGANPDTDRRSDPDHVRQALSSAGHAILGAWEGPHLLAVAGLMREPNPKRAHLATIWGVYATPPARGAKLGRAVVVAAIALARTWRGVDAVQLAVSERALAARSLYDSLGFIAWGIEPDALRVGDEQFSETHMVLRL
jgi:GNAT superfamily N-acetyltransferase